MIIKINRLSSSLPILNEDRSKFSSCFACESNAMLQNFVARWAHYVEMTWIILGYKQFLVSNKMSVCDEGKRAFGSYFPVCDCAWMQTCVWYFMWHMFSLQGKAKMIGRLIKMKCKGIGVAMGVWQNNMIAENISLSVYWIIMTALVFSSCGMRIIFKNKLKLEQQKLNEKWKQLKGKLTSIPFSIVSLQKQSSAIQHGCWTDTRLVKF